MKDFLKYTLATITGIILICLVLFFFGLMSMMSLANSSRSETKVENNTVMKLQLDGTIVERSTSNPWDMLMGSSTGKATGLNDILSGIKKAKENDKVLGIYIQGGNTFYAAPSSLQEMRNALEDFKTSGKFIVAYGDNFTQEAYYVASVADKVMMNPQGMLQWQGMVAEPMFYKDMLDKIGVEMQIFKVGTYKSAVEPYMLNEMSDANREQLTDRINSIWNNFVADVSASRNISAENLQALAEESTMFNPSNDMVKNGLVDTLIYKNDVKEYLKKVAGLDEDDNMPLLSVENMANANSNVPKDKSGNIIAVYYAVGEIDPSTSFFSFPDDNIQSDKMISELKKLQDNDDVKAVVIRVNSPGGSAFGSEQLWYAITQLKEKKPVIVSMGDYAASGGYYLSCNADLIFAEPTTLTGSIGIFGTVPNAQKLAQKVGLSVGVVKTNKYADLEGTNMLARPMTDDEKGLMQMYVNNGYDTFLTRVSEGRHMTKEQVDAIGQGRVWTGERAKELGLVDMLGGLDDALDIAIQRADVESYTIMNYPAEESMFSKLLSSSPGDYLESRLMKSKLGQLYYPYSFIDKFQINDMLQARMPYDLNIR